MISTEIPLTSIIKAALIDGGGSGNASRWMTITDLRAVLETMEDLTVTREEVDAALTELMTARKVKLIPESNQKTLTPADREAAIWLGGEYRHLVQLT